MLNVLFVNTSADQGGAAAVARGIFESLKGVPEVDAAFVAGRRGAAPGVEYLKGSRASLWGNTLAFRLSGREGVLNRREWGMALDRHLEWADVVHLHNAHGYYLPHAALGRLLARPVVWTLHDYWLLTGRCASPSSCRGYLEACGTCTSLARYPAAWLNHAGRDFLRKRELIAASRALFVAPSRAAREAMIGMGMPQGRIEVVENPLLRLPADLPIEEQGVARQALGLPAQKKIALFVANRGDEPDKGLPVLVEGAKLCGEEWHFLVIGRAPERMVAPAGARITLLGPIAEPRLLWRHLMAADLLVNPSLSETFGLVVAEALACGCPVLCSDLPVFRELEQPGVTFFEAGNAAALAQRLSLHRPEGMDGARRGALAAAARQRFSLERAARNYLSLYTRVVTRRTGGEKEDQGVPC